MHQKIDFEDYQIYPPHLRKEMFEIDEKYILVDQLLTQNKLPKINIPDFPLSCELLTELFFGKRPEKKT